MDQNRKTDNKLGLRIKNVRKESHLTQEQFASMLNLKQQTIAVFESGTRMPSNRTMNDICQKFGVNKEWLLNGEGVQYRKPEDKLSEYVSDITDNDDYFIKDFIMTYMELDPTSREAIKKLAAGMAEKEIKRRQN